MSYSRSELFLGFFVICGGIYVAIQSLVLYPDLESVGIWDGVALTIILVVVLIVSGRSDRKVVLFSSTHLTDEQPEKKSLESQLRKQIEEQIERDDVHYR